MAALRAELDNRIQAHWVEEAHWRAGLPAGISLLPETRR